METINGYQVVGIFALPDRQGMKKNLRVIMVDRGPMMECGRYVTSIHCAGESEWSHGHYHDDRSVAMSDFHNRCQREY